jgi:hypothetical protein
VLLWIILRHQTELINYETINIKYYQCWSVLLPKIYRNAQRFFFVQYYIVIRNENSIYFEFLYNFTRNSKVIRRVKRDLIINMDMSSCEVIFIDMSSCEVIFIDMSVLVWGNIYWYVLMWGNIYSCHILIWMNFLNIFRKIHKYQITRIFVPCERICWMRSDRERDGKKDEANSRLWLFCWKS